MKSGRGARVRRQPVLYAGIRNMRVCACLQLHAHIHAGKDMHKHVQKNMHPHIHMKSRTQSYGFHTQTHTRMHA